LSLVLLNFYHSLTSVSALQALTRQAQSLFPSQSQWSSKTQPSANGIKRRRQNDLTLSLSFNSEEQDSQDDGFETTASPGMNRREVFSNSAKSLFAGLATPFVLNPTDPANALLLRFPVGAYNTQTLKNNYHFLRAGISNLEVEGIYSTNPLFLTNRENALSDEGLKCLNSALDVLKETPSCQPTLVYHSLAANGMDTGDLIARELKMGRDRLMPEFTYLDQRGIGLWDSSEASVTRHAVWAMDQMEAGNEGFGGRPPANTDGTPNDTLHDQFTRLRQFLSLQETRTSGETILVIFPDGTGPALLSCMIAGIPYSEAHALEYKPGELRLDISPESVRALYKQRKDDPAYLRAIEEGKEKLEELRSMQTSEFSTSYKDSQSNEKQVAESEALIEKQKKAALEKQKADQERREAMQGQMRISEEKQRLKVEQRKQEELAKKQEKLDKQAAANQKYAEAQEASKQRQAEAKQKQVEAQAAAKQKAEESQSAAKKKRAEQIEALAAAKTKMKDSSSAEIVSNPSDSPSIFGMSLPVLATAAVGAIGAVVLAGGDDEDEANKQSVVTTKKDDSGDGSNALKTAPFFAAVQEKAPTSHTTAPVSIDKKLHHVPAANVTSVSTFAPEIHVQKENVTIAVSVTPITTLISEATTASADSSKKEYTKKKAKLKPLTSDRKDYSSSVKATETQSTTPYKKKSKPKLKPLTKPRKIEEASLPGASWRKRPSRNKKKNENKDPEQEFTSKLQAAEQEMKKAFVEAADVKNKKQQQLKSHQKHPQQSPPNSKSSLFDNNPPIIVTKTVPTKATNFIYNDDKDDSDWLRVLSEIREESGDNDDGDDFNKVDYASLMNDAE